MGQVILFVFAVLLANVSGWSSCINRVTEASFDGQCGPKQTIDGLYCSSESVSTEYCCVHSGEQSNYSVTYKGGSSNCSYHLAKVELQMGVSCKTQNYSGYIPLVLTVCTDQCEADSVAHYSECISAGNVWNRDSCKCVETEKDTTITYCINTTMTSTTDVVGAGGFSYQQITRQPAHEMRTCHCKVRNGTITECEGKMGNIDVNKDCPITERSLGTCNDNGKPDGPQPPNNGGGGGDSGPARPYPRCYAVTGRTCHIQESGTGRSWSCDCDGSCDYANNQIAMGEGECYRPPVSSPSSSPSSGGSSSPSSGGSSSPSSSGSSEPSSSGSGGENGMYMEVLEAIQANTYGTMQNTYDISQWTQTTMNNTIDMKNQLSDIGIDISHIRDNTLETASNTGTIAGHTGSIDGKLSTTNSLLNDIKNKNWNPTINVDVARDTNIINVAGDTNIINVNVEGGGMADTSRAPAEILAILRQREGSDSDTNGMGAQIDNVLGKIDSLLSDSGIIRMNGDSVENAVDGLYSGGFGAFKDSLNSSAFSDSMARWTNQLTNNGTISGNGSDQCPNVLTRTWTVNFPIGTSGVDVQIGPLGTYMCSEVAGMGITFWALCRVILRAIVAIGCMIWLYKSVLGIDGGNNDEED